MATSASVVSFFVSWIAYLLAAVLAVVVVVPLAVDRPRSKKG